MICMEAVDALIEKKRQEMIRIAGVWGFTSQETIKASQELDSLLNSVLLTDKYIKETVNV
ncbi:hypothetical protein BIV59_05065 [Bacillus sp. MUM 13]|nr:hypothetical protein BIV59_05065 [Bacillus sp. MUM 13]